MGSMLAYCTAVVARSASTAIQYSSSEQAHAPVAAASAVCPSVLHLPSLLCAVLPSAVHLPCKQPSTTLWLTTVLFVHHMQGHSAYSCMVSRVC